MEFNRRILLNSDTILLEYEGKVDRAIVLDLLSKIESILEVEKVGRLKKRKLINIAIETLQNLQLHAFPLAEKTSINYPTFLLTKDEDSCHIIIGNLILNEECSPLQDKLEKINSLNDEEIKFLYGVIMKQTVVKFSTKGGAGLGLIDMKKKSGNPLGFNFQNIDKKVSYFSLKISVPISNTPNS